VLSSLPPVVSPVPAAPSSVVVPAVVSSSCSSPVVAPVVSSDCSVYAADRASIVVGGQETNSAFLIEVKSVIEFNSDPSFLHKKVPAPDVKLLGS
jgi:hypothetical protein